MTRATLDPAIEEVLRDIAKDPKSKLFAFEPRRLVQGLSEASVHASVSEAGLRSAERHLLATARTEVASLLLERFRELLLADERNTCIYPHERSTPAASASRFAGVCTLTSSTTDFGSRHLNAAIELLRDDVGSDLHGAERRQLLLHTAIRLTDTPTVRVYVGLESMARERFADALRVASQVIRTNPQVQVRHSAYELAATAIASLDSRRTILDDIKNSLQDCRGESLSARERAVPLIMLVVQSIKELDRSSFQSATAEFSEVANAAGDSPSQFTQIIRAQRRRGWALEASAHRLCSELHAVAPDPLRGVLNALL